MNDKFLKFMMYPMLLTWIGGCVVGIALNNHDAIGAGLMSFIILCILGHAVNGKKSKK